jgi:hypothetical protein
MSWLIDLVSAFLDPGIDSRILPYVKQYQGKGYVVTNINNGGASVTLSKAGFFGEKVITVFLGTDGDVHVVK